MKFGTSAVLTIIMTALQVIAQLSDLLPPSAKRWVLGVQIVLEATKALIVHFSNPDGTRATLPYIPKRLRAKLGV